MQVVGFFPFLPRFGEPVVSGRKVCTARNKKYGERGDVFDTPFGVRIRLLDVGRVPLSQVAYLFYKEEGVKSPQEFIQIWNELHPAKPYNDDHVVYLHKFEVVR